jgi:hypothetical protein
MSFPHGICNCTAPGDVKASLPDVRRFDRLLPSHQTGGAVVVMADETERVLARLRQRELHHDLSVFCHSHTHKPLFPATSA